MSILALCPLCGFEVFGEICPACGTAVPYTQPRKRSAEVRRGGSSPRERFVPPPAPKDQPALLHDASPVFSPVYTPEIQQEKQVPASEISADTDRSASKAADAAETIETTPAPPAPPENAPETVLPAADTDETAGSVAAEASIEIQELPSDSTPEVSDRIVISEEMTEEYQPAFAEAAPVLSAADSAGLSPEPADFSPEPAASESVPEITSPVLTADASEPDVSVAPDFAETVDVSGASDNADDPLTDTAITTSVTEDEDSGDIFSALPEEEPALRRPVALPPSLLQTGSLLRSMLMFDFTHCAEQTVTGGSTACWQWLLPLHIICGSIGTAVIGHNIPSAETFRGFGASFGAGAILWCEHFVVLLLLVWLLFSLTGCRIRPVRIFETVCAALVPLAVLSIPAALISLASLSVGLSLILFGIILSAHSVLSAAEKSGVFRTKYGKPLAWLILLADIILASMLINSII